MDDELSYDDFLPYGKYEGETVWKILEVDRDYLKWAAVDNVFTFDEQVLQELS